MTELKILRRSFAYAAFVFALVSFAAIPALLHAPFPRATANFHADILGIILISMRELILMLPPALAVVSAMAWWTLSKNRASARIWALTGSSLFLVYSLPFFVAAIAMIEYSLTGAFPIIGVFASSLFFSSLGVTGLACFSRSEALTPTRVAVRHI
jgi:hypothetical protein